MLVRIMPYEKRSLSTVSGRMIFTNGLSCEQRRPRPRKKPREFSRNQQGQPQAVWTEPCQSFAFQPHHFLHRSAQSGPGVRQPYPTPGRVSKVPLAVRVRHLLFQSCGCSQQSEKERTKQDGTNISLWLKSLASFCGTLFRRYAMMDCTPILQYLVNQLKANNSKDLVIMSELITKMSGIEPLANLADAQIAALTGWSPPAHGSNDGRQRALTGSKERIAYRRSGQRLLHALVESKLSVPLSSS